MPESAQQAGPREMARADRTARHPRIASPHVPGLHRRPLSEVSCAAGDRRGHPSRPIPAPGESRMIVPDPFGLTRSCPRYRSVHTPVSGPFSPTFHSVRLTAKLPVRHLRGSPFNLRPAKSPRRGLEEKPIDVRPCNKRIEPTRAKVGRLAAARIAPFPRGSS
jgi:hypothetical protein